MEHETAHDWMETKTMAARQEDLNGRRIAILATNGVEQIELTDPRSALEEAGAEIDLVSPESNEIRGWDHTEWGTEFRVDVPLDEADARSYDALLLPGGVMNPDNLRRLPEVQAFVRSFFEEDKPVAAICHAPWILIDAGVVKGRELTSYHTLQEDLKNADARWVDREVVVDGTLVTSRSPEDLPAFHREMIALFARTARERAPA